MAVLFLLWDGVFMGSIFILISFLGRGEGIACLYVLVQLLPWFLARYYSPPPLYDCTSRRIVGGL